MSPNDLFTAGPSSTADEMALLIAETERRLQPMRARFSRMAYELLVATFGREVCARRARSLRRRGHAVVRLHRRTSNGKARFRWMPRLQFTPFTCEGISA